MNTNDSIRDNLVARGATDRDHHRDFLGAFSVTLREMNVLRVEQIFIMIVIEESIVKG